MSPTVDSLLPLSFLEAVRNVDTPDDDPDTELVAELRNKRLGLSDTVYAQIRRYSDAVKRSQRTVRDEAVALARLIGRRPDAEAVFRAAGRYLANEAYQGISPMTRQIMLTLPSLVARPIALASREPHRDALLQRQLCRASARPCVLDVPASVTIDSAPRSIGCAYYEAGLAELLASARSTVAAPSITCDASRVAKARAVGAPSGARST